MPKTEVTLKPSVETLEQRLDSMDRAIILLQDSVNRMPTPSLVMAKVEALESVHGERFNSIQTQFRERDTRTEQAAASTKIAVDAALSAAKEAVGAQNLASAQAIAKAEAATTKQIDAIGALIAAQAKGVDDKIDDVKGRVGAIEGRSKGFGDGWVILVGAVGILGIIASIVTAIIIRT